MENRYLCPRTVLRVDMNCCEDFPKKLKRAFLDIKGVDSVVVDPEEMLVYVTGKVDPTFLVKATTKMGIRSEVLSYEKEPISDRKRCHSSRPTPTGGKGKEKKKYDSCRHDGNGGCGGHDDEHEREDFVHKVEDYVPPKFDEKVCGDPFCILHRSRPIISQRVPLRASADHPHHNGGGGGSFHNYYRQHHPHPHHPHPGMSRHRRRGLYGNRNSGCSIM